MSEDSLNISNELPNLQPKDLKFLEQLEQELSITSLPPSPPITPPARFYPYQSGVILPAAVCIKQEIKFEPVEVVQQATTVIWPQNNQVIKLECSPQSSSAPSPAYSNYSDSMVPMSPSLEQKRRYPNSTSPSINRSIFTRFFILDFNFLQLKIVFTSPNSSWVFS